MQKKDVHFCLHENYVKEVKPLVQRKNNKKLNEIKLLPNWLRHV